MTRSRAAAAFPLTAAPFAPTARRAAAALWALVALWAAPAGAGSSEPIAAGGSSVTVGDIVPLEGVLAYVAFELEVPDDQLARLRRSLKALYVKRQALVRDMESGAADQVTVRTRSFALRRQLLQAVTIVLEPPQAQSLLRELGEAPSPEPGAGD